MSTTDAYLALAIPVLPTADVEASLRFWIDVAGFTEVFRHGDPVSYAGIAHGPVRMHLSQIPDAALAKTVGEQTMVRFVVKNVDALHARFAQHSAVHPNGPLREVPWGGRAFDAIDPGGVCVTFSEP